MTLTRSAADRGLSGNASRVSYAPAPEDRPAIVGINRRRGAKEARSASADAQTIAFVSKVQMSRYGALSFVRLYAGRVARGDVLMNAATETRERIGRLLRIHADKETEIDAASAGDVVAVLGLKVTGTGEVLSASRACRWIVERERTA